MPIKEMLKESIEAAIKAAAPQDPTAFGTVAHEAVIAAQDKEKRKSYTAKEDEKQERFVGRHPSYTERAKNRARELTEKKNKHSVI